MPLLCADCGSTCERVALAVIWARLATDGREGHLCPDCWPDYEHDPAYRVVNTRGGRLEVR